MSYNRITNWLTATGIWVIVGHLGQMNGDWLTAAVGFAAALGILLLAAKDIYRVLETGRPAGESDRAKRGDYDP